MTGRYCYTPCTARKIGRRVTLIDRIRKAWKQANKPQPDVYPICNFHAPVYPGK